MTGTYEKQKNLAIILIVGSLHHNQLNPTSIAVKSSQLAALLVIPFTATHVSKSAAPPPFAQIRFTSSRYSCLCTLSMAAIVAALPPSEAREEGVAHSTPCSFLTVGPNVGCANGVQTCQETALIPLRQIPSRPTPCLTAKTGGHEEKSPVFRKRLIIRNV